jgi:beta-fructofuranosidase
MISSDQIRAARELRLHLLDDPYRPAYHFVVPEDFARPADPNGAIWWNGRYHLGYIYQDDGVHFWGHVSSRDLLHWRHHKPWLVPTPDSPELGIYSGNCMINKDGAATMFYHGYKVGNCIATSDDPQLDVWKKLPTNPIVPVEAPDKWRESETLPYASWDPCGWLDGDTYYAIFGGTRPAVFKAKTLDDWSYVGDLFANGVEGISLREDVSCPDFFRLGEKWVLMGISHENGCRYYVGDWKDEQFHPQIHERMSWTDNTFFAPESMADPKGRRLMWAWIFDQWDERTQAAAGWSGVFSIARELWLRDDLRLGMRPIEELKSLRYNERRLEARALAAGETAELMAAPDNVYDLEAMFEAASGASVGLEVCCGGSEETIVGYDGQKGELFVDTRHASAQDQGLKVREAGPFRLAPGERLELRVLVDRSVVEVFANERQAITRRIYPDAGSRGIRAFSTAGDSRLAALQFWEMMPSNPY